MSRNQLDQETSPYLLLSKDMPVHWRPWGAEALAEAQQRGKPIHLSVGYTACHWCHVMNTESYADPEFAALLNENFINIKVDREERPDIDQLYQTSLSLLGTQGGWPLTMFLTPTGEAFAGNTYLPPVERQGALSFRAVVDNVLRFYREQPEQLAQITQDLTTKYAELWNRDLRGPLDQSPIDQSAIRIGQRYDVFFGGLLGMPKFPNMPHVEMLFRAFLRTGMGTFNILSQTTLANVSMGGIYDHVGGGLHRYATDERWLIPHFKKMLNDNALYIDTLVLHWQYDRNPLYQARIEETVAWMLRRNMMVGEGFASSIDADSEGEEGKYYLWSEAEIDAALAGTFTQKFKQVYNVAAQGPVRGKNVLCRIGVQSVFNMSAADESLFKKQREMLLAVRSKRVAPVRDNKVLADWNGMAIAALANAGSAMRKTEWTVAAMRAFEFVEKILGDGDKLYHSWCEGKRQHAGFSDDYAHMARAALALWQATNDPKYLARAKGWVHQLNENFWDSQNGGYFSPAEAEPLTGRIRTVYDVTQPCANGVMPEVLAKLFMTTLDPAYRERTNALLDAFSGEVARSFVSMTAFLKSLETVIEGLQIIVIGPLNNPKTHELMSAVRGRALANKLLMLLDPSQPLPEGHPAFGKTMDGGRPTAYICQRNTCSAPITNPVTLSQALQLPPRPQQPQPMPQPVGRA